jgi:endonuclease III
MWNEPLRFRHSPGRTKESYEKPQYEYTRGLQNLTATTLSSNATDSTVKYRTNHVVSQVGTNIFVEHIASMVRGDEKRVLRQCHNPEEQTTSGLYSKRLV